MASAHRQPGSPHWFAFYRGADGRRKKKALAVRADEVPRTHARKLADELERTSRKARVGLLTEAGAREAVSDMLQLVTGRRLVFHSVEGWLRDWLADKTATKTPSTGRAYRCAVESFMDHLGERVRLGIEMVTPGDVRIFRDSLVKAGSLPQTANNYVKILRIPFGRARKQGLIPANPAEAVDSLPTVRAVRDTFTAEQVRTLLDTAEREGLQDWVGAVLMGIHTGQRLTDVTTLRWANVDLAASLLSLTQRKTKHKLTLPLHPELSEWLLAQPTAEKNSDPLFPTLAGRGTGGAHGLSGRFAALMEKAGIRSPLARDGSEGGRKLSALSFHSFRHTFTSLLANRNVSPEIRRQLTGHQSEEIHRLYTHHELAPLRAAMDVLPSIRQASKPAAKKPSGK